jgi:hypothetical protein
MFTAARRDHPTLYADLKDRHPRLFAELPEHRRRSPLSRTQKLLYPVIYGGRRRYGFEAGVRRALQRLRVFRRSR